MNIIIELESIIKYKTIKLICVSVWHGMQFTNFKCYQINIYRIYHNLKKFTPNIFLTYKLFVGFLREV